ncbi:ADP-ribosylation factor GTPase-activating protein AGD7 [Pelomyxa schiedti]|nr:ADP-ribosylation factor GTPase-activating protein AGD7 [Pelomyxa schiedti]
MSTGKGCVPDSERDALFKEMKQNRFNSVCVECGTANPQWASIPLGIFICYACSGIHRSFGTHISFVRSLNMDSWTQRQLSFMKAGGNENYVKYLEDSGVPRNAPWVQKYPSHVVDIYKDKLTALAEGREWIPPRPSPSLGKRNSLTTSNSIKIQPSPANSPSPTPTLPKSPPISSSWDSWDSIEAEADAEQQRLQEQQKQQEQQRQLLEAQRLQQEQIRQQQEQIRQQQLEQLRQQEQQQELLRIQQQQELARAQQAAQRTNTRGNPLSMSANGVSGYGTSPGNGNFYSNSYGTSPNSGYGTGNGRPSSGGYNAVSMNVAVSKPRPVQPKPVNPSLGSSPPPSAPTIKSPVLVLEDYEIPQDDWDKPAVSTANDISPAPSSTPPVHSQSPPPRGASNSPDSSRPIASSAPSQRRQGSNQGYQQPADHTSPKQYVGLSSAEYFGGLKGGNPSSVAANNAGVENWGSSLMASLSDKNGIVNKGWTSVVNMLPSQATIADTTAATAKMIADTTLTTTSALGNALGHFRESARDQLATVWGGKPGSQPPQHLSASPALSPQLSSSPHLLDHTQTQAPPHSYTYSQSPPPTNFQEPATTTTGIRASGGYVRSYTQPAPPPQSTTPPPPSYHQSQQPLINFTTGNTNTSTYTNTSKGMGLGMTQPQQPQQPPQPPAQPTNQQPKPDPDSDDWDNW